MISHLVLLAPRGGLSTAERLALVDAFKRAVHEIPTVRNVRVGSRVMHGAGYEAHAPDTADYLIAIDFDDVEGLKTYLRHPAHEELGVRFGQSLRSAMVFDFEVGGLERLDGLV